MTTGQKIALSLLITVIIFASFSIASFAGLFSYVETRFYRPLVLNAYEQKSEKVSQVQSEYYDILLARFKSFTDEKSVLSYFDKTADRDNSIQRENLRGSLFENTYGLKGLRLIDANKKTVHYSSFLSDVKTEGSDRIAYSNLENDELLNFDFTTGCFNLVPDTQKGIITFQLPSYDENQELMGVFVFYLDKNDLTRFLTLKDAVSPNDNVDAVYLGGKTCIIVGLPSINKTSVIKAVTDVWDKTTKDSYIKVSSEVSGDWIFSYTADTLGNLSGVIFNESLLLISYTAKVLLFVLIFITLYLLVFFILNFKHDDTLVINSRIKKFEMELLSEYINSDKMYDLDSNINQLCIDIKNSLGSRGEKYSDYIEKAVYTSMSAFTLKVPLIGTSSISAPASQVRSVENLPQTSVVTQTVKETSALEVVEEIEEAETLDEVEEIEEAETLDEVEEIEEVETLDEVEEIEEAETLDEAEEIEEAEPLDEAEEIKEAETLEEVEEIDEAELQDEVENLEETLDTESLDETEANCESPAPVTEDEKTSSEIDNETAEFLRETEAFSSPEESEQNVDPSYLNGFTAETPDYTYLDEDKINLSEVEEMNQKKSEETGAEPVFVENESEYMFSLFSGNSEPVSELEPVQSEDAVIEDKDGVYRISSEIDTNLTLNDDLVGLVESVI